MSHGITTATPGINQHSTLDRLPPNPTKKMKINKELKTNMQQREWKALSALEKEGGERS
jgi:hypothetical protein